MWNWIGNIGALFGIGGISIAQFLSDADKAIIALCAFLLLLFYVGYLFSRTVNRRWKIKYPKGYLPISTIGRMLTTDGKHIVYETTRHIQVKQAMMHHFEHRFFWTGTNDPKITSSLQTPSKIDCVHGEKTKCVKLKFPQTRVFDEVEVIHMRMDIDDSDAKSETFLSHSVDSPVTLISWRIELPFVTEKYNGSNAVLLRTALKNNGHPIDENIATIPFDAVTKSFFHDVTHPEPGYEYKLSWPRP